MSVGDDGVSADVADLDRFVERSAASRVVLAETRELLAAQHNGLAGVAFPVWIADTGVLGRYDELLLLWEENERFVADVSLALQQVRFTFGPGIVASLGSLIDARLDRTNAQRLTGLETVLVAGGIDTTEAAKIRVLVETRLDEDPTLSFADATIEGFAVYLGVDGEEAERRGRAFTLQRSEAVSIIGQNFDVVAGRSGNRDQVTVEDLIDVADDPTITTELRDAAYRLAADGVLFADLDVALQTDLTAAPFQGFAWHETDGILGRDDFAVFGALIISIECCQRGYP